MPNFTPHFNDLLSARGGMGELNLGDPVAAAGEAIQGAANFANAASQATGGTRRLRKKPTAPATPDYGPAGPPPPGTRGQYG